MEEIHYPHHGGTITIERDYSGTIEAIELAVSWYSLSAPLASATKSTSSIGGARMPDVWPRLGRQYDAHVMSCNVPGPEEQSQQEPPPASSSLCVVCGVHPSFAWISILDTNARESSDVL
ncbi:Uu.00g088270.m01.CDS01 [Anthostomella pinea]|uniref:Uu.00g088270.m01.CDS01 n=1 Tax=Anthostomella pinea TaxID=933095 RepID=A0AAI8VME7_9PEZI|nr:Uu.00g088270.m01.CDS01 [Anthostomella pinea]